jgi:hypothetical protein
MKFSFSRCAVVLLCGLGLLARSEIALAQHFTINIGTSSGASTNVLVAHGADWNWRRGTNAPQADWRTAADASLDATWVNAPGGFGYGDNAIVGEATRVNPGMSNIHTTLYIRRTFTTTPDLNTNANLILTVDYDDGFVAYLDGVEIARRNVPGAAGSAVLNTATTGGISHEASCCNSPNPPVSTNFGPVLNLLPPGDHVLAIVGVNADPPSSDFHLIPDLVTVGISSATNTSISNLGLFALSTTNVVTLAGSNTLAGATRVTVNGDDANVILTNGTWSLARTLSAGMNRFYIAALDGAGNILSNLAQDIVYQAAAQFIGGTLPGSAAWNDPSVVIRVTNNLFVPSGQTLDIGPGVVVLLTPNASIIATNGGTLNIAGADENAAFFLPADGTPWGSLMANGSNAFLTIRHAEIVSAQVRSLNGGTVLMEDSVARELPFGSREIVAAVNGGGITLRRSRLDRFTEIDARETPVLVEDCLIEGFFIDGLDIKGTNVPLVVRGSTLRFASVTNDNADAIDFGPGPGVVERCLIHDFPDKGVSIGGADGTSIRDTLIYNCGIGISAYSSTNIVLVNNTIAASLEGILFRNNPTPAIGRATNLIVWGNSNNVVITNTSLLAIEFSDLEGTNYPGLGNISSDPLFVNAAAHDYRLSAGSPALGTGGGGVNMGAPFPVGGIPSQPLRLAALTPSTNYILLNWIDDADNDAGALVQRSINGTQWQTIGSVAANATSYSDFAAQLDQPYYYRVRATNGAGVSAFSNPTRAVLPGPVSYAGGVLTGDTIWSGTVLVTNAVTVPGPFTLTISAGTIVRLTNSVGITATGGGHTEVNGTREQPVIFERMNTTFTRWGDLAATGAGSTVSVRFAKITHGRVRATSNGTALVEDSELSQMTSSGIIGASGGALFTVRRTYVHDYEDIDLVNTRTIAEDSLFERANSDIFELQNSPPGSVLRRCTFRNCLNPNSDGVDMNGCVGVLIDSCRIYNVTDKAVSSGSANSASDPTSFGLVVSNTLIHTANIGIGIKDSGTAALFNNTISDVMDGVAVYAKFTPQGGYVTNGANNLIWGVTNAIHTTSNGTVTMTFNDLQGTNWPGVGNISIDPLFLNALLRDYRVATNSPVLGAGQGGHDVGARFPVGASMALSHPRIEAATLSGGTGVVQFWADSEKSYTLQVAPAISGATWTTITNVPVRPAPVLMEISLPVSAGEHYLRLQTP